MNLFLDIVRRNERRVHTIYDVDDVDHNQNGMSPLLHEVTDYPSTTSQRPFSGI